MITDISNPGVRVPPGELHHFRQEVAQLLERKNISFPGAQPVSFARRHLDELTKQDYYVCEKSDGIRYLMYCTENEQDGSEAIYLIDRKNEYHWVNQNAGIHLPQPNDQQAFHKGTLIDGELVLDTLHNGEKQAKFLVFDCLVLDRKVLMSRTLDKRLAYFREFIFDPYQKLYQQYPEEARYAPFFMEMKSMQFAYGIEMMFRQILPKLPHGNDGLIFTCRNTEYCHGTDQHILKWKPEEENSIDFRLSMEFHTVTPDEHDRAEGITEPYKDYDSIPTCNLFVNLGDNRQEWYGELYLTEEEWDKLKALQEPLEQRIVECYMDAQKRWRLMKFRDDKHEANHISTAKSVIESITDRVTEQDLLVNAKRTRDEWKRRQQEEKDRAMGGSNQGVKRKADGEQGGARPSPGPHPGGD